MAVARLQERNLLQQVGVGDTFLSWCLFMWVDSAVAQARWGRVEMGLFAHVRNHYQSGGGGMGRQDK